MNHKKVSIITACKNAAAFLERTIASVREQTYSGFEYIVVDGASTDETAGIIGSNRDRIDKWVSEPDRGVWHAMNKGIALAEGDYLYFLNAGDRFYRPETLSAVFRDAVVKEDLVYGNIIEDHGARQVHREFPGRITTRFLLGNMICHQATFARKELFERYGYFDERFQFVADYDFLWKCIIRNKATYRHIPETIAYYDMHGLTEHPGNREQLVREWTAVHDAYLPLPWYVYLRFLRPLVKEAKDFCLKP